MYLQRDCKQFFPSFSGIAKWLSVFSTIFMYKLKECLVLQLQIFMKDASLWLL
jgi:hypothetical protein